MSPLEGANCSGLPSFVIDKYFDCNVKKEPLRAMVALAICGNCTVLEACRDFALNGPYPPHRGVMAGTSAAQIDRARQWRRYEQGLTETPPRRTRPEWLPMTDATHGVEQWRTEEDPDEQE